MTAVPKGGPTKPEETVAFFLPQPPSRWNRQAPAPLPKIRPKRRATLVRLRRIGSCAPLAYQGCAWPEGGGALRGSSKAALGGKALRPLVMACAISGRAAISLLCSLFP